MSRIKELLQISDEEVRRVRERYQKTEEDIAEDVNILLDWLVKQPHLPKPQDRGRLERFLLRNKFRIEQTKTKLDNYYAFKTLYPELYLNLEPDCEAMQTFKKSLLIVPMPKLLPNLERLYFAKFIENQEGHYSFPYQVQLMIMFWELQLSFDYGLAEAHVWDLRHLAFKHILKFDINLMQKGFALFQQAFSARMARVEYINVVSSFVDVIFSLLKRIMNSKLFSKVRIVKDMESLYEVIPREYLPDEIGGTGGSAQDICDKWDKELILQKEFLKLQAGRVSNEQLRIGKPLQNDLFGIEGTFKKINLD